MRTLVHQAETSSTEQLMQSAKTSIVAISGTGVTWWLQDVSLLTSATVGVVTVFYILAQLFFLLRKWYLLEKSAKKPEWE